MATAAAGAGSRQQVPSTLPRLPGVMGTHLQAGQERGQGAAEQGRRPGGLCGRSAGGGAKAPQSPLASNRTPDPGPPGHSLSQHQGSTECACHAPVSHTWPDACVHVCMHTNTCAHACMCKQARPCTHTIFSGRVATCV